MQTVSWRFNYINPHVEHSIIQKTVFRLGMLFMMKHCLLKGVMYDKCKRNWWIFWPGKVNF